MAAHDALDNPVYGRAIVDIAAHERRVDGLSGHEDRFEIDALFTIKSFMIRNVERQEADVRRLDTHSDFFDGGLAVNIGAGNKDRQNQKPENDHGIGDEGRRHYRPNEIR